ncbi:MAG: hypothetical protein JXQ27_06825 [Acidobacteria bacterium]|nr:hypothetical protein [Acidobacteriota bacterium]
MKCQTFQDHLMEYLYEEIEDAALIQSMEAHLTDCKQCRHHFEEGRITHRFLRSWEDLPAAATPARRYDFRRNPWWEKLFGMPPRWVWASAGLVMILGIFLSVFSVTVHYTDGIVEIRFGDSAPPYSAENVRLLRTIDRMIADSEERVNNQTLDYLQNIYYRVEEERLQDRQSIEQVIDICGDQLEKNNQLMEITIQNMGYSVDPE